MRSIKLMVATAVVAALVAGPVLAQDAMSSSAPATSSASGAAKAPAGKHRTHKGGKKHANRKMDSATPAPAAK
jgi:type IV secretory pathway TrbL component